MFLFGVFGVLAGVLAFYLAYFCQDDDGNLCDFLLDLHLSDLSLQTNRAHSQGKVGSPFHHLSFIIIYNT